MKSGYRHIDPEKMTSQERLDRIIEILVLGGLRLVEREAPKKQLTDNPNGQLQFEIVE
jgi:hypothetical protein